MGTSAAKENYNDALLEQIATRDAQRKANKNQSEMVLNANTDMSDAAIFAKRRRHESRIAPASKESYHDALLGQIAERDAQPAANAFHVQAPDNNYLGKEHHEPRTQGKRLGMVAPDSKESYRSALQHQIHEGNAKKAMQDYTEQKFPGVLLGDNAVGREMGGVKGRRHAHQIAPASKQAYAMALQDQIVTRSAQRAANAFHAQVDDIQAFEEMAGNVKGRRHGGPVPVASKQSYAIALQEQIAERDVLRNPDGCQKHPPFGAAPPVSRLSCNGAAVVGQMAGTRSLAGTKSCYEDYANDINEQTQIPMDIQEQLMYQQAMHTDPDALERLLNEQTFLAAQ